MNKTHRLAAVVCVAALAAASMGRGAEVVAGEAPEVTLRNVRWQALPSGIRMAFVGPDQRMWYSTASAVPVSGGETKFDVAGAKAEVAAQWASKSPVLNKSWPVLFGQDKSVWFLTADRRHLLGYDGRAFVEREANAQPSAESGFVGVVPGSGSRGFPANAEIGGTKYFVESNGVEMLTGGEWNFLAFAKDAKETYFGEKKILRDPDGKSALIVVLDPARVWRVSGGKIDAVALPAALQYKPLSAAEIGPDGKLWVINNTTGLTSVSLDGKAEELAPGKVVTKVMDLDMNQFMPSLCGDGNGSLYISAVNLPETMVKSREGVFIVPKEGPARLVPNLKLGEKQMFVNGGKGCWISGGFGGSPAAYLDLTAAVPKPETPSFRLYNYVQCIAGDGTVFFSLYNPLEGNTSPRGVRVGQLVAYKPGAPDDRKIVVPEDFEINGESPPMVAGDGTLYAVMADQTLKSYDGKAWAEYGKVVGMPSLHGGVDGSVFLWQEKNFALIKGKTRIEGENLRELIKKNRDAFAAAFSGPLPVDTWRSNVSGRGSMAVDGGKRIWLLERYKVAVLLEDWVEVPWEGATDQRGPGVMYALADGSVLVQEYADIFGGGGKNRAMIGSVVDGKPVLKATTFPQNRPLRDSAGGLWFSRSQQVGGSSEYTVQRVGAEEGTGFKTPGAIVGFDRGGMLWFGTSQDYFLDRDMEFWREGKKAGSVELPGLWVAGTVMFDKPGSLWVWTTLGLHHLLGDDAKNPTKFTLQSTAYVEGKTGGILSLTSGMSVMPSAKGFMACVGDNDDRERRTKWLHVVRLGE